jgi:hypothetical protein
MKWYLILKLTFNSKEDRLKWCKAKRNENAPKAIKEEDVTEPDNHFPSVRIKMHELQRREANPCVQYYTMSTSY